MWRLQDLLNAQGQPCTAADLQSYLLLTNQRMHEHGWAVIGSQGKLPNLHPWKECSAHDLYSLATANLQRGKANSLTLRLADTGTVALDCDFRDSHLMQRFTEALGCYLGLVPSELFTCHGKKGGKLFFQLLVQQSPTLYIPRSLGMPVYTQGHAGDNDFKQELEVKRDLSTFAGVYGSVNGSTIVYGPYASYAYIADATPEQLPSLTWESLLRIEVLYRRVLLEMGFVDNKGFGLLMARDLDLIKGCVAFCYQRVAARYGTDSAAISAYLRSDDFNQMVVPFLDYLCLRLGIAAIGLCFGIGLAAAAEQQQWLSLVPEWFAQARSQPQECQRMCAHFCDCIQGDVQNLRQRELKLRLKDDLRCADPCEYYQRVLLKERMQRQLGFAM